MLTLQPGASLQLLELGELGENELRLLVIEAIPNGPLEDLGSGIIATPVTPTAASRTFEIVWSGYVSYLVENESYAMPLADDLVGRGLHFVSSSPLLDFVASVSIAPRVLGQLGHYCLVCDSHVIHVIGAEPPTIREKPTTFSW